MTTRPRNLALSPGAIKLVQRIETRDDGPFLLAFAGVAGALGTITANDVYDIFGRSVLGAIFPMPYSLLGEDIFTVLLSPQSAVPIGNGLFHVEFNGRFYKITANDFAVSAEIYRLFNLAIQEVANSSRRTFTEDSWWRTEGRIQYSRWHGVSADVGSGESEFEGFTAEAWPMDDDKFGMFAMPRITAQPSEQLMAEWTSRNISADANRL